jgi:hypothetical protein
MGGKAGASGEVGRGETPNVLSFFSTHRSNIPLFHYSSIFHHSNIPSIHRPSIPTGVPARQSPDFPYNQVSKLLPAKVKLHAHRAGLPGNEISFLFVPLDPAYKAGLAGHLPARKLTGIPKRGGPAGGRGERISFAFVGLMDQWHIAEIFRDKHNKLLPVGNENEDCNGGQDKGKDGPGNPLEPYLPYRTSDE